jgi:Cys-tRNA(Pro)/Cys-tRNA(Cys) deacylase
MTVRNNVTRLLDANQVAYELFELPPEKHSAEETAALLGVPEHVVYKTLVILREQPGKKPLLVMAPAGHAVDLRVLAAALGEKKLRMATQQQAEALTGLQTGGISPLALLRRGFVIYIDAAALELPFIHISAGQRGANVRLPVPDLIRLTGARSVPTG